MNEDILYQQYLSNNTESPISIEEFTSLKSIMSPEDFDNFVGLKKKENSQETPSSSSGLGENQPTPTSAQGNPQVTSVPISQDLDLNQAQIEAMQGVQNPASLNLELPQQSDNQNGSLESNGEVNTSSSVLEDSFNNFIQEGGQLPLNPTSTRLNVLPRAYEEQFKNVTESAPQVSVTENINTTNNDFVDFGNGITLPKELLPEEKTKEEFNKEIAESAKDVTLKQSGKIETFDIENPKWINRNRGNLQGEEYVNAILQDEKEGKVKVARNDKGELIDEDLKPILDNSNVLWQPIGSYINDYNSYVNKFNKEIELNNQKISQNNALIESQNIRDLFLGKKEEPKSPLTTLYNKIYSDTGILLTEEQKAQFNTIDDVYNFYASEKAKKAVQDNPRLNYNEEYNKLVNELNPKISTQQSLQLGKKFVNNFLLGFRIEEEKSFNEARGYGAKIDPSYQKGYNSKDDLQEINFINNLSNNDYGLGLIGEWWNAVGKKEIGTTNYKINATLSTPEGRADVINSIANYINARSSIQKELAYENIQREKFNNLKNAKEGNVLALQDSINFIQSESNKINQIDTQQKEIYDFIDSWKKTQVRNNKKEQEFARTYSGYQSGEILPSIKIIAGNTVNGISDAVKSTIAGVAQLPNLAIGSDEYNDVISEIKKPSEFFGVKTSGMFSKYYDYKSGGKNIRFQNGNYYELVNGDYRPINLTYAQISNLGKAKEGEEFSIAGMIGDTTRMATEIGLSEFTGAVSLKALSKFSQLRNIERVSSVFGEESALTNSLQRLERFSKNPTNNGYFGWFTQTIADNYQEAKAKGMTNTQASVYGSVQSLLTSFLSRINPDVKFFKTYKEIDEKLIGSLLKNDKQGFLNNIKSLSNHIGGEISSETGQELTEQFAQELVKQFYNTSLTDKKFDTMTADDVLKTVITTAITTGALTSSNLTLRGSGDNIINYDNAYYNSTQLSDGQKLVMLANLNTSEIFKNFNNQFISDKNKLNEIEQTVKSVKTYLDKIPNKDKYTLNTQTKAVSLLYEIDQKRKELNKVDESFKDDINNEINSLTDELKQLLNDDLKLQDEQPQQTTQPEQTQETAQGQTTETTLQPEQGTVATEQGVSTDVVNNNQNIQNNGKKDTRTTVQEQGSGEKMLGNEQRSQENGQNTDLGLSSMGEQNQEQRQTTKQVEEVATNITEEEQVKINLERLNAYIEAKKQREQEQKVQVSQSSEMSNVQQNETFSVNEQPQTIEQPSETQNTPLVSESKSTNSKYTIRVEQNNGIGTAKILDNNGNEVKLTNKQKEKYVAEHFAKQAYPETVVEDGDKLKPSEFNQEIINTSNNPLELAQILDTESEFIPSDLLDAKENAIANVIGNKVSRSSFIEFGDENYITFSIARGYGLTNNGKEIDTIAQEAEVFIYQDWDSQNPRVTTQDVINFMTTYKNGADTFFRQPNPRYIDAAGKFEKITGIKATKNALDVLLGKKTATKIDFAKLQEEADILSAEEKYNLRNEYNEWFNSLSLEDKNLELQKTYPYEQRTEEDTNQSQNESVPNRQSESSKNVANQERDGATTEEINQVSPSTQYEGAVTYTQFGEGQEGTLYYEDGVAKIKDKAGKVYNANSPLVKNLKDAEGNTIQLQKGNQKLTPITKQAFDALVTKLQKAFPRFAKVTYDFEAFKKQAEKLGATFNDIQRMVMAFHGSPHSFDKFSTNYIGTGEGNQAFGWGLYFTDLESIARNYAYNLSSFNIKNAPNDVNDTLSELLYNDPYIIATKEELEGYLSKLYSKYDKQGNDEYNEKVDSVWEYVQNNYDNLELKSNGKLYKVSLHKGKTPSEYTWLEWDKEVPDSIYNTIGKKLKSNGKFLNELFQDSMEFEKTDGTKVKGKRPDGLLFYKRISQILGSDKDASLWLLSQGIDGIKYPAESISRGSTSDTARGFNYVVFDENAVTIEDKIQFMQTPNGTIYGAKLPDGTIYLNPEFLNANTPIHEFSHLFEQLLPSRFKKGVELLKQTNLGKKLFEQLKQEGNYANLTDEQLWGEALNTHIGNFGENEVNNPKGKLKQLQDWIKDFFAKVGDVLGIKKLSPDTQLRMFTEGVVKDLLGGKPIVAENQVSPSGQVQYSFLTENDYDTNGNIKPEVLAEIQAEREGIKAEAQANGTFMKAPNGNTTNLNEAQWIDVRTKRFKDWFGDWENDAKNASKVVDENGEPLVVYHGTTYPKFYSFKESNIGIFFTDSKEKATGYAGGDISRVMSVFLDIKNPLVNNYSSYWEKIFLEPHKKIDIRFDVFEVLDGYEKIQVIKNDGEVNFWSLEELMEDIEKNKNEYPSDIREIINFEIESAKKYGEEKYARIQNYFNENGEYVYPEKIDYVVATTLRDSNKDGLIFKNISDNTYRTSIVADVFALQSPTQIKSATANVGTYSASSNDIRFSINSTTPLSVKEQTEVINDLVANGEESAFAKLQETNWYKGLSEEQKQNINPTNVAETVINEVNSTKRNLEQKVERRDAKIEKLQQEKDKITKSLKDKIKELKSEYKDKIAELNALNKSFKEKFAEKVFWKRQAVNAIKLILKDKYIRKNVTDNDIIKLLNLSDRIFRDKDVNVAFENFEKYLDKVMSKEDAKEKRDKEKYDKIYNEVEAQFNNGVSLSEIVKSYEKDTDKERAKKAYYEIQGKSVTPEQAVEMMEKINKAEEEMLNPKKSFKDRIKTIRQGFNQKLLDRQWLPKQLLERAGAMDTFNRLVNFGGASSKAKMLFDRAYRKIWFGLGIEDIKTLNNIIQNKRVISIAENRAKRGLDPINNTVSEITINAQGKNIVVKQMMTKDTAQAYLDGVKAKIGEKKFNKLSQRAEAYFAEFKNLLDALLDNGMIRQEAYDSMVEIDYQPRVFLEHLLDYDQKLSKEEQEFRNKTNGLTKELIKQLENGSEGALLSNSQLLLASAINSRVQAIAMNDINKQFITKDFPKARIKFEAIDPKNFKDAEERRFYKYFKELDAKVIIPEGNTIDAKQGYSKAYYFENGVRKEFLLEDELHGLWHDKVRGLNPDMKQKLSYATGSSLLKGMATGYNPAFIIVNTPRDFLHTLSFSPEYRGVALWEGALLATDFARATAPFVGSIYKFNKGKDNVVRKYFEYGGGMDFLNQQGIAERDNVIRGTYQRLLKYLPQVVQDTVSADAVGEFLSTIALRPLSNYSELGFRIANFTRALENQLSDYNKDNKTKYKSIDEIPDKEIVDNIYHYAVSSTRGLLDFNQGGTFTKDAESVLPYINAGVQGTRAAVQAFRKDPIGVSTQIAQIVTMTSVTFFGIGLYFIGAIRPDDEDEDKETLINNYLDFRESLTPEQKKNYFALPVGYNKADNSYEVLLVAKSQPLTPLFVLSEEISENILKRQVDKEEKSMNDIIASMGRAFSDNIDPTSLSTLFTGKSKTFADNVKTTAGKLASRNPAFKGVATALSGYDFYFNQPLQDTESGKLSKFEGQSSNRVEQFYKDFGLASNFSPVRTKAFIESIVTSPTTNPFVGMFYAGSDAIFTDVTVKEAIKDFLGYNKQKEKWMFRETPVINRAIKETSDFSRQLNQAENIKADDEYVKALEETEYMRMKSDEIISEYLDKARNAQYQDEADDFVKQGLEEALIYAKDKYKDDPIRGKQFMDRAITKLQNYDTDGRVWDIKYSAENNPEAQAFLIYSYFGDIEQNEDSERIIRSLKAAGLTSNSVMSYYQKIVDKNKK